MIFSKQSSCGDLFVGLATDAIELAKSGETVVFFWNRAPVEVTNGMTFDDVEKARDKVNADLAALRVRPVMSLIRDKGEREDAFISRGLAASVRGNVEVTLTLNKKKSIKVQPWTKFDVAKYVANHDIR